MNEYEYSLECPVCETQLSLMVIDIDEKPINCPMCGTETEWSEMQMSGTTITQYSILWMKN